ncbi:MAG TPA: hypothetical protein VK448_09175 [Dissulfurispiraceae bacterium]|nr:hypothetical protein [Dissulfurispiraceae bacterium]
MIRLLVVAVSILLVASCAVAPVRESGLNQIKPGGIHEECASAKKGEKIIYSFYASLPVDFNVHYHAGEKIYYPFERKGVTLDNGTYVADHENVYCLMWTNNNKEQATVNYKYEIQPVVRMSTTPAINRPEQQMAPARPGY